MILQLRVCLQVLGETLHKRNTLGNRVEQLTYQFTTAFLQALQGLLQANFSLCRFT